MPEYNFVENTFMVPYTQRIAEYCHAFSCGDDDLDEFFSHDVFLYEEELLGKTYCWINKSNDRQIVAIATLSYDGIKTYTWIIHPEMLCNARFLNKNDTAVILLC